MKTIRDPYDSRWFIWTLVVLVVGLGGLSAYVYISYQNEASQADSAIVLPPRHTPLITEDEIINTMWVPEQSQDAIIAFSDTKKNDPKRLLYDYHIASDSVEREVGFWQVVDGEIILTPTDVITSGANISKITVSNQVMLVYTQGVSSPERFVPFKNN